MRQAKQFFCFLLLPIIKVFLIHITLLENNTDRITKSTNTTLYLIASIANVPLEIIYAARQHL